MLLTFVALVVLSICTSGVSIFLAALVAQQIWRSRRRRDFGEVLVVGFALIMIAFICLLVVGLPWAIALGELEAPDSPVVWMLGG